MGREQVTYIRKATIEDISRIAEIVVFNYRLNFYPIFRDGEFYFKEMQVVNLIEEYQVNYLWALEKNVRAISFYERYGFNVTGEKKLEEDTTEYLVRLVR